MPKISPDERRRRRDSIIEASQRCFALRGYDGATVARLEEATGASRGAIFNYFPGKRALFAAVVARSAERLLELWLDHGYRALFQAVLDEDPDWLAVQLEAARLVRRDPGFRAAVAAEDRRQAGRRDERLARLRAQGVRDDVPLEAVALFLGLVANGLAVERSAGERLPDLETIVELVERGVLPASTR